MLARLVEAHGHAALYCPEHSHIPASADGSHPGGHALPPKYAHTYLSGGDPDRRVTRCALCRVARPGR